MYVLQPLAMADLCKYLCTTLLARESVHYWKGKEETLIAANFACFGVQNFSGVRHPNVPFYFILMCLHYEAQKHSDHVTKFHGKQPTDLRYLVSKKHLHSKTDVRQKLPSPSGLIRRLKVTHVG